MLKGPYWHTFGSSGPRALARGPMPPEVCQYGPAAYHSRVVTFLLHIFGGFHYSQTKIAQTEKGDNKYFS